jgi:hypothetical protein
MAELWKGAYRTDRLLRCDGGVCRTLLLMVEGVCRPNKGADLPEPNRELPKTVEGGGTSGVVLAMLGWLMNSLLRRGGVSAGLEE